MRLIHAVLPTVAVLLLSSCAAERQKHAFVLGGNGFIGGEVVLRLIDDGFFVTTANRGNWYWDSPGRVKPRTHRHYTCDRTDGILHCWDLRDYIRDVDYFDVVLDFTAFRADTMKDLIKTVKDKAKLLMFISSDSVYMVCKRDQHQKDDPDIAGPVTVDDDRPWKEEDAVRPYSATLQERLHDNDPYGHDKMECEEVLVQQRKEGGIPYVILRLPDVLGGRDTTNRWFPYQIWLQFFQYIQVPFRFSEKLWDLTTSYVYVHDVSEVISKILQINSAEIFDKAYNIAFEETMTIPQLLQSAQKVLGIKGVKYEKLNPNHDEDSKTGIPGVLYLFPSVNYGSLDITRAKTLLGWKPTPLQTALQNITSFYKWAFGKFPLQRDKAVRTILHQIVPEERKQSFHIAVMAEIEQKEREIEEAEKRSASKDEKKDEL